ncbi:MAG: TIGR04255 family protein [Planctomycetes bacterium]|nr:TIGR04255 family protein [Planctomycetota bacterium]
MSGEGFKIDLSESFEHLPNAPIVEAVIHWRARAERKLEPAALLDQLKAKLPDYPHSQRQQEFGVATQISAEGESVRQHHAWHGYRFESADKLQIAQYTRNGFVFSRLKPYQDWEKFQAEAQRLWCVYRELAEPSEIQRLGVRFINLIPVKPREVASLLTLPPRSPQIMKLPISAFLHQTKFNIPDHPYELNVVQTIQPPAPPERDSTGLILDLDVGTTRPIAFDEIENRLLQMQSIKNKAFFSLLKKPALKRFRS